MSSTQFWVGMLVPPLIKWVNPILKKLFKLKEFDSQTQAKVTAKQYPAYFTILYGLWVITLLASGVAVLLFLMIYGPTIFPNKNYAVPVFLGLINMIGVWFIFGALWNILFWQISSENFRDYVISQLIKSGWGYDIKQQVVTLLKIGIIYYIVMSPIIIYLVAFSSSGWSLD